ncbi:hypothetical protein BD310DRAFT_921190 [Dichomitus squalens]|nr:hypothetical protein BD310DRAFT_921190 [Dichomitus squalens]
MRPYREDSWDSPASPGGTFSFRGLVKEMHRLTASGIVAPDITSTFDDCAQMPCIHHNATQVKLSYDDAASFEAMR